MRILAVATAIGLSGCSLMDFNDPVKYEQPNPPTRLAELRGVGKAAKEEGLTGDLQISDFRTSDFGPGRWMICLRGTRASQPTYFAVFFKNEDYKGVRLSVIGEACEVQSYSPTGPLPAEEPDEKKETPQTASPAPKADRHRQ